MFLAAFEPGKEMAIANFFLAIFCLFTFVLPLLLITRSDKAEANRNFITATVNPWYQLGKDIESNPAIDSGMNTLIEARPKLDLVCENNDENISETVEPISINSIDSEEQLLAADKILVANDEVLAA
tara:strand:- start:32 stop:412 length:381 start_codon:yes stop_codon:yes gene_type:complete